MTPSQQIDHYIDEQGSWKREKLHKLRELIHQADPEIVEDWKWDVPIFVHKTMVCAISAFKDHVKINFFKGAALPDPDGIINNGLESKQHRSVDFREGDSIPEQQLLNFIISAIALHNK